MEEILKEYDEVEQTIEQEGEEIYVLEGEPEEYSEEYRNEVHEIEESVYISQGVTSPQNNDSSLFAEQTDAASSMDYVMQITSQVQTSENIISRVGESHSDSVENNEELGTSMSRSGEDSNNLIETEQVLLGQSQLKEAQSSNLEHVSKEVQVSENASLRELEEQYKRVCAEKNRLHSKLKGMRQKCNRIIERLAQKRQKAEENCKADDDHPPCKKKKKVEVVNKRHAKSFGEIILYLEKEDLLSEGALRVLQSALGNAMYKPIVDDGKSARAKDKQFSPEMKVFSKTLLFYSCDAYHNVRDTFDVPVPPASITRTWFNTGIGHPGWSSEAFLMVKDEVFKTEHSRLDCSVIMGEFKLRPGTQQNEKSIVGHVDYGTTCDVEVGSADDLPLARSALFLMVVPVDPKKKWRIPVAFFLTDYLTPDEQANILLECLWRLFNMGSMVLSVVMDAHSTSREIAECLGLCFDELPYPLTSFPHPADGLSSVHVIFDTSHLFSVMKHTWASVAVLVDESGGEINWQYFTELIKVQETQAGCTEQSDQIATWYWDRSLMRKRLIAQLFSVSVADAMECCCTSIQLPQFIGCEATVNFIRMMDKIFKLFKSKYRLLNESSLTEWKSCVTEALNFIFVLRDKTGQGIFATNIKVPFVCIYMNLLSLLELVKQTESIEVSRLSLEDLDLLFIAIRKHLNWKTYPTVNEFMQAYVTLLQDDCAALSSSFVKTHSGWWIDLLDVTNARKGGIGIVSPMLRPDRSCMIPQTLTFYPVLLPTELQRFRASQLVLVHTLKRVVDLLHCDACILGLQMQYVQDNPTLELLRKTCGGFVYPSQGVVEVCASAERHLKVVLKTASQQCKVDMFKKSYSLIVQQVCVEVMLDMLHRTKSPFPELIEHSLECAPDADHICRLIRALTVSYVLLRIEPIRVWCV